MAAVSIGGPRSRQPPRSIVVTAWRDYRPARLDTTAILAGVSPRHMPVSS
ncbi:MAG: hypothetical protein WAO77_08410 [Sphingobium sp.]